ncbi:hypothetical protein NPIL_407571 [Nephila pilipes]|uniref:Uncharacterized protein n=1 Tax=Nephila pilipes TaxID=299642 RepID=A0A8X6PBA9_NEPPI|nr:hypothetical protein NPIL_407571 [Nephila pilipes]
MLPTRDFWLIEDTNPTRIIIPNRQARIINKTTLNLLILTGFSFLLIAVIYIIFGLSGTVIYLCISVFVVLELIVLIISIEPKIFQAFHHNHPLPPLTSDERSCIDTLPDSPPLVTGTYWTTRRTMSAPSLLRCNNN